MQHFQKILPIVNLPSKDELVKLFDNKDSIAYGYVKMLGSAPYVRAMGHKPDILNNIALSSRHGNPTRELPRKIKEMIASGISMFNSCEYCITSHTGILKGLFKVTDEELVELACVVGHVNGLNFLEKVTSIGVFPMPDCAHKDLPPKLREEYEEIPDFIRFVCHDPELLNIIWNREKVTMKEGKIDPWIKDLIALCISVSNACPNNARVRFKRLQKSGIKIKVILEGIWVAERFHKNTKITSGLLLETSPDELLVLKKHKDQL